MRYFWQGMHRHYWQGIHHHYWQGIHRHYWQGMHHHLFVRFWQTLVCGVLYAVYAARLFSMLLAWPRQTLMLHHLCFSLYSSCVRNFL